MKENINIDNKVCQTLSHTKFSFGPHHSWWENYSDCPYSANKKTDSFIDITSMLINKWCGTFASDYWLLEFLPIT